MAYIYVAEESTPGYKHDKEPYNTAENSQYVLTVTGDEIGRDSPNAYIGRPTSGHLFIWG